MDARLSTEYSVEIKLHLPDNDAEGGIVQHTVSVERIGEYISITHKTAVMSHAKRIY